MTFLPAKTAEQLQQQTQRLCYHLVLLRVQGANGQWLDVRQCADCLAKIYIPEEAITKSLQQSI